MNPGPSDVDDRVVADKKRRSEDGGHINETASAARRYMAIPGLLCLFKHQGNADGPGPAWTRSQETLPSQKPAAGPAASRARPRRLCAGRVLGVDDGVVPDLSAAAAARPADDLPHVAAAGEGFISGRGLPFLVEDDDRCDMEEAGQHPFSG